MALIQCPDCGKMISSRAATCPNCGCPAEFFNTEAQDSTNEAVNAPLDEANEEPMGLVDTKYSIGEYEIYAPSIKYQSFAGTLGEFVAIGEKARDQLIDAYCDAGDIQTAIKVVPEKASQVIDRLLDKIMGQMFQCGINMSIDDFINKYYSSYNMDYSIYYESAVSKITDILEEKRAFEEYKKIRNASRSRWSGGGFGLKGAIKGAFTASILNAGTDFVRSIGDAWKDPSNADFKRRIEDLYYDGDMFFQLTYPIYDCVINAYFAFKSEMLAAGIIEGDLFNFNEKEADLLFENSSRYSKNREELIRNTLNCIQLFPIKREYYLRIMPEIQAAINAGNKGFVEYLEFWGLSFYYPADKADRDRTRAAKADDIYDKSVNQISKLEEYIQLFQKEYIKDMPINRLSKLFTMLQELYLGERVLFEYNAHGLDVLGTDRILFINGQKFFYDEIVKLSCKYDFNDKKIATAITLYASVRGENKDKKLLESNDFKGNHNVRALCALVNIMINAKGAQNSWKELLNDIEFSILYNSLPSISSYKDCTHRMEIVKKLEAEKKLPSAASPLVGIIEEEIGKFYLNNLGEMRAVCREEAGDNYDSLFSLMISDIPFYNGKNKILSNIWFSSLGSGHKKYPQRKGLPSKIGIEEPVIISYSSKVETLYEPKDEGFLVSELHMLTMKSGVLFSLKNIQSITKEDENHIKIADNKQDDVIHIAGIDTDQKDLAEKNIQFLINLLSFFCVKYAGNPYLWNERMGIPRPEAVNEVETARDISDFGNRFLEFAKKVELKYTYNIKLKDIAEDTLKSKLQYSIEASPESFLLYYDGKETLVTDDFISWHNTIEVNNLLGIGFDPDNATHPIAIRLKNSADIRTVMICEEPEVILAINEAVNYDHAQTTALKFCNKKFDIAGELTDDTALAFGKVYVSQKVGKAIGSMILTRESVKFLATDQGESMTFELSNIKKCEVQGDHFIIWEKGRFLQSVIYSKNDASWVQVINAAMRGQYPTEYVYITDNGFEKGRIASIRSADKLYNISSAIKAMANEKSVVGTSAQPAQVATNVFADIKTVANPDTVFCVHCGNKIQRQSKFCAFCGKENKYGRNS